MVYLCQEDSRTGGGKPETTEPVCSWGSHRLPLLAHPPATKEPSPVVKADAIVKKRILL